MNTPGRSPDSNKSCHSVSPVFHPDEMLMYGKEASNRKQEIDRQHHTIPNKRTKDQKTSIMEKIKTFGFFHNDDYYGISLIPYNLFMKLLLMFI